MQDWYTTQELADLTGADIRYVQTVVRTLRRTGVINTMPDPRDERRVLVHRTGLVAVKKALLVDENEMI